MSTEPSAAQTRIKEHCIAMAARCLERSSPTMQAQAIASHYAAHASVARSLLKLLDARHRGGDTATIDSIIAEHVRIIKTNHASSLGIKLEWPKEP